MNISEREPQQSYWCSLCRKTISFISSSSSPLLHCLHCHSLLLEEIESPTTITYPNLFSNSKDLNVDNTEEEEDVEVEVEDNNKRRQYTCFQCNMTISLISSSSSPLLLCPHCHAEFWEVVVESLSPSSSTTNNLNSHSNLHVDDIPEEDEDRCGNSLTVAETEEKMKKNTTEGWRRVIYHKIRTFFGVVAQARCGSRSTDGPPPIPHSHSIDEPDSINEPDSVDEPEYPMLRNRLTALIIDGSEFQRIYHKTLLSSFCVDVWEAKNGYEAFGLILRGIEFDVIFIDMDLPVLNGTETTRILRRVGIGSMIVGIAAYVNRSRDQRVFRRSGLDDYHERMFTYERLYGILRMLDDER